MTTPPSAQSQWLFVGTYSEDILLGTGRILEGKGKGIYTYRFNPADGTAELSGVAAGVRNPSYLTFGASRRFLYCVNELKQFQGQATGAVSAFSINQRTGALTFLNTVASHGADPCNLVVDPTGRFVLVANYSGGSVCVLPIHPDGSLGEATHVVKLRGASVDPIRQATSHAHAVTFDQSGRLVYVSDLGADRVMIYRLDTHKGALVPNEIPWLGATPGAGPRQLVIHPRESFAYAINELNSTMTAYRVGPDDGGLTELQTLSTLPAGFVGHNSCAEVQISPLGKFLYGANRGHDSIVAYAIDERTGLLALIGHEMTQGKTPRNFAIHPHCGYIAVANQDAGNLVVFRANANAGTLDATGYPVHVPTPICVRFLT